MDDNNVIIMTKGRKIICKACGKLIAIAKRNIYSHEKIMANDFEAHDPSVKPLSHARCSECDYPYILRDTGK